MISAMDMRKYCIKTAFFICAFVSVLLFMTPASKADDGITTDQPKAGPEKDPAVQRTLPEAGSPRHVVSEHLQAIRMGDAHEVWQYFSKNYQEDYRSPNEALRDIKTKQKLLFNHVSYHFLEAMELEKPDSVIEKVELVTRGGGKALAFFRLKKTAEDVWKIDHITLLETDSKAI